MVREDPMVIHNDSRVGAEYELSVDDATRRYGDVNHTQRPDVVQGHHANSRRRIEATAPPTARTTKAKRETACSSTLTDAPAKGKQRPPAGKTTGGKPALARARAPNAIPADDGDEGGNEVDTGEIMEMLLRIETAIGSFSDRVDGQIKSLSDRVDSLCSRMDVVETRLSIEHTASLSSDV